MIGKTSVRYLASPVLISCEDVAHAFLSRSGGVSQAPFDSLNLGYAGTEGTDSPELIDKNFAILGGALGVTRDNLFAIRQVHGSRVAVAEDEMRDGKNPPHVIEADAAITALTGGGGGRPRVPRLEGGAEGSRPHHARHGARQHGAVGERRPEKREHYIAGRLH